MYIFVIQSIQNPMRNLQPQQEKEWHIIYMERFTAISFVLTLIVSLIIKFY